MNNVSQEMFLEGLRLSNEANSNSEGAPMEEPKTLEAGCATHLVAAVGAGLGGMFCLFFLYFLSFCFLSNG